MLPHNQIPALTHGLPAAAVDAVGGLTRALPGDANLSTAGTGDRPGAGRAEA